MNLPHTSDTQDYDVWLRAIAADAQRLIQAELSGATPPQSLRALYQLWIDSHETAYAAALEKTAYAQAWAQWLHGLLLDNKLPALAPVDPNAALAQLQHALAQLPGLDSSALQQEWEQWQSKLQQAQRQLRDAAAPDVGVSRKTAVYQEDKLTLYRYADRHPQPHGVPVLIVYALVNRPYIADLQPDRSLIRQLSEQGQTVYLLDWGYPDAADKNLGLADYIAGYLDHCVDFIREEHDLEQINLLGICQGGTFSLCYSALHRDKINKLVTMVTPVDFHTADNRLTQLCRYLDVERLVERLGNLPGHWLTALFISLKPFRLGSQKYFDMLDFAADPQALANFLRMEKWIFDSPDQAGAALRQFVSDLYQQNKLRKGTLHIGARRVDLGALDMPILNIYAEQDHLVPPAASRALADLVSSYDYQELSFPGGHIGIYVSRRAQQLIPPQIAAWLSNSPYANSPSRSS